MNIEETIKALETLNTPEALESVKELKRVHHARVVTKNMETLLEASVFSGVVTAFIGTGSYFIYGEEYPWNDIDFVVLDPEENLLDNLETDVLWESPDTTAEGTGPYEDSPFITKTFRNGDINLIVVTDLEGFNSWVDYTKIAKIQQPPSKDHRIALSRAVRNIYQHYGTEDGPIPKESYGFVDDLARVYLAAMQEEGKTTEEKDLAPLVRYRTVSSWI